MPTATETQSTTLYYRQGSSDKVLESLIRGFSVMHVQLATSVRRRRGKDVRDGTGPQADRPRERRNSGRRWARAEGFGITMTRM